MRHGAGLLLSILLLIPFNVAAQIDLPVLSVFSLQWIAIVLGLIAFFMLLQYQINRRHAALLVQQVKQQTAALEAELQNRKTLEDRAKRESDRLQTLLDHTIESVITIDTRGVIQSFNKASIQLYGYQPEDIIGRNITRLMPARYRSMHEQGMARFLSTEQSSIIGQAVQVEGLHKSGQVIPIEMTLSAYQWEGKYFFTGIARDISMQQAEHQALIEAKEEAEKANQAKSEFLSSMSHELRTPLNAILGFTQLLKSDIQAPLSPAQQDNVDIILQSGEHLLKLINEVLELSKIETGYVDVSIDTVDIATAINDCLPMLQNLAADNDAHIDLGSIITRPVLADVTKLKQVLINLVSNAIKYNRPQGTVSIRSEVISGSDRARITVTDSGIGIAQHKQSQLFTAFNRLGQEYSGIEGTGVGLIVTQRLITAMQGYIGFDSTEGVGSRFWVELPLAPHQAAVAGEVDFKRALQDHNQIQSDAEQQTHYRVIYIEDNPANIKLMQAYFDLQPQLELHVFKMAETSLKKLHELEPSVILMDINLPGISGLEATRQIRDHYALSHIPVIAVTAAAMPYDKAQAAGLFSAYLTKPIDFSELSHSLSRYLPIAE